MGAVVYDALLLLAVLFLAAAIALPFNGGRAYAAGQYYFPLYLLGVAFTFYGWFWVHGGQTLGMRAWKIRVFSADGGAIGWRLAGIRFASALLSWSCLGLGFLWCIFDQRGWCWHDYLSRTHLVWIDREKNGRQK